MSLTPIPVAESDDDPPPPPPRCLDCEEPLRGEYCHACGQRDIDPRASLRQVLGEFIRESVELDGRLPRTLLPFLFRPGFLAREFLEGRRRRYTSPVRLYVFCALVAFFVLAQVTSARVADGAVNLGGDAIGMQQPVPSTAVLTSLHGAEDDGRLHFEDQRFEAPPALRDLDGMDRRAAARMLIARFFDWAPIGAVALLFLYTGLLALFFPRVPVLTHLVGSTHVHAFALLALATAASTGRAVAAPVALAAVATYTAVGLWNTYRQAWWITALKFLGLALLYTIFLALAAAGVALAMLFVA